MPPGFYNPYDQQVYDAGFKYIPQSQYLLNPFKIPGDGSVENDYILDNLQV